MRCFIREIRSYRYMVVLVLILFFIIRTFVRVNNHLLQQVNMLESHIKDNDKFLRKLHNQIEFADSFTKINGHIGKVLKVRINVKKFKLKKSKLKGLNNSS